MKKVLIVSPNFPPINAPDMQRVRLALPFLREHGWEPTVLAVAPEFVESGVRDPLLEETYPADIRVVRVRGIPQRFTRWAGIGSLWWRCGRALRRTGDALLAAEKFDLVFFSTTLFGAFSLGPRWRRRFGVPYVLDYQDPWTNDYYARTGAPPPGGRLRYSIGQWSARRNEPRALRDASGVIAVSPAYGAMLAKTYAWFDPRPVVVLPFGASAADIEVAARHRPADPIIDFADGFQHHVYAGRGGEDMAFSLTVLFRALKLHRQSNPVAAARLRLHFVGTNYGAHSQSRDWVMPHAQREGVADLVREHRHRVPYFDTLHYLRNAHALMVVGSNDSTYSASKIFPYVLARRPLLLIFHRGSLVLDFAERARVGVRCVFDDPGQLDQVAADVRRRWYEEGGCERALAFDETAFVPFLAAALTARLAEVFDAAAGCSG